MIYVARQPSWVRGNGVNLHPLASGSEAQVITWVWCRHLKWRMLLGNWALHQGNLILDYGRWCQDWAEFLNTLLMSENCLLLWGKTPPAHIGNWPQNNKRGTVIGNNLTSLFFGHAMRHVGSSSLTRDWTHTLCIGSADHHWITGGVPII